MNMEFVRNRIAFLRTAKNISARELSLRLGQSVGYINHIEIGTSNPSIEMLFYICEELGVTMSEFFEEDNKYPLLVNEILQLSKTLNKSTLESVISVMKKLSDKK